MNTPSDPTSPEPAPLPGGGPDLPTPRPTSWQRLGELRCELGESPFWHPLEQRLYWVDIAARQVLRADLQLRHPETWTLPSEPGCLAPVAGGGLVLALRSGIFRAEHWGGPLQHIASLDHDPGRMRANDGKCDALGRFWVSTIDESRQVRDAALYCIDARGPGVVVQRLIDGATTGNGLAFAPDGRTLYWADTPSHTVRCWDLDPAGPRLSGERTFARFAPKPEGWRPGSPLAYGGRPDGATVDARGQYWVALYEGARLCQFAADGRLLSTLAAPVRCPTMPCLAGPDLRTLVLTSARHHRPADELAELPESGGLWALRTETPGLPVHFFQASSR